MEDIRTQQLEALETMYGYNKKLRPAINEIIRELREERKEDTKEYLDMICKGINWVIQVTNGTLDLLNEKEVRIEKEVINEEIININAAFVNEDDIQLAEILEKKMLPFLETLDGAAMELAGIREN